MNKILQAGGLVIRTDGDVPRLLIIRAKKNPQHWVLPKGHIESGESAEETATREVEEEAGVEAAPIAHAGSIDFNLDGSEIHVEYYLMEFQRQVGDGEQRGERWCTLEEADELLSFENTRQLIRDASPLIELYLAG